MKGIYLCAGQDIDNKSSGITRKIYSQIEMFNQNDLNMKLVNFKKDKLIKDKIKFILPFTFSKFEKEMIRMCDLDINWSEISFVYIRRITFCKGFVELLIAIKKHNKKINIFMEIPTFPIKGEYSGIRKILSISCAFYSKKVSKYIDRIVTYSNDDKIWGIKTINISNSVDFKRICKKKATNELETINMIAVALYSKWHGYDRIIRALKKYYEVERKRKIHFYLVGYGEELTNYENMIKDYKLDEYIHVLGPMFGEKLDSIYDRCNIAIDAMGRYRSKVYYNSSLKGKEYGAKGLPIISGVKTELDSFENFKYYFRVPNDDSDIDIEEIINFYDSVYCNEKEDQVIDHIRAFNEKQFDFHVAFSPVINIIKERCNNDYTDKK